MEPEFPAVRAVRAARAIRKVLGPEDRIALFFDSRSFYYWGMDYVPYQPMEAPPLLHWLHARPSLNELHCGLQAMGVTHVLVHESGLRFLLEEEPYELLDAADLAALDRLRAEALVVVWQGGDAYTLYAWSE